MGMVSAHRETRRATLQSCPRREEAAPVLRECPADLGEQVPLRLQLCLLPPCLSPSPSPCRHALVFVTVVFSTGWTFSAEALKFTSFERALSKAPPLAPLKSQIKRAILLRT